jgi:hypothetical protein
MQIGFEEKIEELKGNRWLIHYIKKKIIQHLWISIQLGCKKTLHCLTKLDVLMDNSWSLTIR